MRSGCAEWADGQRVGGQRCNGFPAVTTQPDGTVEISVTSQMAGSVQSPQPSTAAVRAGTSRLSRCQDGADRGHGGY